MGANWRRMMENLARLEGVPSRIAKPVAARITNLLRKEFKQGADSYGTPWVPLRPSTIKKKGHDLIMIETGETQAGTYAIAMSGGGIQIVSTKKASYHMEKGPFGRPARPVLPHKSEIPESWRRAIVIEWNKAFKSAFKGL